MALWAGPVIAGGDAGFKELFNGKDFSGWDGKLGAWVVEDGAIRTVSTPTMKKNWLIWSGGQPGDFELRLKFRFIGSKGTSGVQVRSIHQGDWQVHGYQVEIATNERMGLWHESLWSEEDRRFLSEAGERVYIAADGTRRVERITDAREVQAACRDGEWNELVIIADGPRLVQIINGVVFSDLTDHYKLGGWRHGVIALQNSGKCHAEFKDIRLKQADR